MSHTVEVVDDCSEDHRPSPDERVVAVVGVYIQINRKVHRVERAIAHEKLEERRE